MGTENAQGKNDLIKLAIMGMFKFLSPMSFLFLFLLGGGGTGKSNLTMRIINGVFTVHQRKKMNMTHNNKYLSIS